MPKNKSFLLDRKVFRILLKYARDKVDEVLEDADLEFRINIDFIKDVDPEGYFYKVKQKFDTVNRVAQQLEALEKLLSNNTEHKSIEIIFK